MSQSLVSNRVHIIFSTQNRERLIPMSAQRKLWSYIVGIGENHGIPVLGIGGTEDHVHILVALPATVALSKVVQLLKANSSKWMTEHSSSFSWQKGYGAFSVSTSNFEKTLEYITSQERHHKHKDFREEFLQFIKRNNIDYDPKYIFD
jgi:putative transposase